jgi:ABC-2 type transport system permease protein
MANVASSFVFTRFDLTSEKRFTLSPATKKLMAGLEDVVFVRVYLDGDFPPAFNRLQNSTREILDELRACSNGNLEYEFINPASYSDTEQRDQLYRQLASKGIQPTTLQSKSGDETSQQMIFPGALLAYRGEEVPVMLLQDQIGASPDEMLNNSVQSLEFGIANAIRKLTLKYPQIICVLDGHGEANDTALADITRELSTFYFVERKRMDEKLGSLNGYRAVIVAAPDSTFSEKDKFIIDQYIMKGGKVLWLMDGISVSMDSLANNPETVGIASELNLDDMLFRYGARINHDLVLDIQAAPIPIVTGQVGNKPQQSLLPWYFFPVAMPTSSHPVVKNLNAIKFEFVSTIDAVGGNEVLKTPILSTTEYSRVFQAPVRVSLDMLREKPDPNRFNAGPKTIAMLLEGKFISNFKNRIPTTIINDTSIAYKDQSDSTAMIVVADGDVIQNRTRRGQIVPLGEDRYTGQVFGNKSFIMNCVDYLCDDSGIMELRSREIRLRLLDRARLQEERTQWQLVSVLLPIIILSVFGLSKMLIRKHRYHKMR